MVSHKQKLRSFHLFAGAGGGILADLLLEHEVIGACEIEKYPRDVLLARQQDGILPAFPIWDDVCTLDGNPWRGSVDILCGGFPCQDISAAGKGAGISGERSGLWKEYARLIGEMRPQFVFAENSPLLRTRGLGVVLEDLAALGYNARWGVLGARDVGAPHKRDRMWILAYAKELQCNGSHYHAREFTRSEAVPESGNDCGAEDLAYSDEQRTQVSTEGGFATEQMLRCEGSEGGAWWHTDPAEVSTTEPLVGRVANGVADRVHRLKAIGNGQVPQCAALAFSILAEGLI
jgi:DNA (cytosine-5)-methyltransferase 1